MPIRRELGLFGIVISDLLCALPLIIMMKGGVKHHFHLTLHVLNLQTLSLFPEPKVFIRSFTNYVFCILSKCTTNYA